MKNSVKLILVVLLQSVAFSALSQKLPNKQTASLRAPANIKIDGKAGEWNNQFQAFNHAVELYYTIANDDKNLYLVIQATDRAIVRRIINGGISFSVTPSSAKDKNVPTITYPVFENNNRPVLDFMKGNPDGTAIPDSVVSLNNQRLEEKSKVIMVTGMKGIDTLISVYNDNGIRAAEKFDNQLHYTCELSVSQANLGLTANQSEKLTYHIVLNGTSILPGKNKSLKLPADGEGLLGAKLAMEAQTTAATDFFGEYVLVKK